MAALSINYSWTNNPNLMEILKKQKQNPCLYHPVSNIFIHVKNVPSKTHYFNNIWVEISYSHHAIYKNPRDQVCLTSICSKTALIRDFGDQN